MNLIRTALFFIASVGVAVVANCSQEAPTPSGTGTMSGATGSSTMTTGAGGSTGDATTGSSTATTGTTGTTSTTATTTTGGTGGSGPATTTTTGMGGTATTTSGGGSGGAATTTTGGGAGPGGAAGSSAGGAGGGAVTVEQIVPTLDGFLWVGDCAAGSGSGKDCPINSNNGNPTCNLNTTDFFALGAFQVKTHKVGGTPGTKYMINFEARGVTGGKDYTGGTRQSTEATFNQMGNDGWRVGGVPTPSKWNTYEIHVTPPVPGQPVTVANQVPKCMGCPPAGDNVYYTNSIPNTDAVHETYPIKIKASFPVLGGGLITLIVHDSNCLGQQNCGPDDNANAMCIEPPPAGPRTMDLSGLSPQPANFIQPYTQAHTPNPWYPQWLYFDVQSVTQM